ncbi:hypothetical protein CsSME_00053553 [Camellia sinensis var. sinensis]
MEFWSLTIVSVSSAGISEANLCFNSCVWRSINCP